MLKTAAMVGILMMTSLLGFYLSKLDAYRLKELTNIKKMALMLATEIQYSSTLGAAFSQISKRLDGTVSTMFKEVGRRLEEGEGTTFLSIWRSTISRYEKATDLQQEDVAQLIEFGKHLGYLDKSMQDKNIKMFICYLDEEMEQINESKDRNAKMYRSLGVLVGLLIVVVMI